MFLGTGEDVEEKQVDAGIERPAYVCFAAQDWWYHNRAHSDFQLMLHVARSRRVLIVNSIGMRMPLPGRSSQPLRRIVRKARSVARLLRHPLPNFWVLSPLVLPLYGSSAARRVNASLVRLQVSAALRRIGIHDPVLFVTIPTARDVVRGMSRRKLVFNRSDKHSEFGEADSALIRTLEESLIREADHVLYASRSLIEEERALAGSCAYLLDHGVDFERFDARRLDDEPADMRRIPHPRLGFFGAVDAEIVDFRLLEQLALAMPDAHLVLIGDASGPIHRLTRLANVHWLGFRPYEQIPAYGACFDVGLMPWVRSDWIRHCNPIKLKEYLALGLPVVSTDFPEVHRYSHLVRITGDADDFVHQVRLALKGDDEDSRAVRRAAVARDSWTAKAAELVALCEDGSPP
jgi:glycosyltransferase involved in cell wall biosynthesis